jgi:very-short-patch-repair endonuclease
LWGILQTNIGSEEELARLPAIDISVPATKSRRRKGIRLHRRMDLSEADSRQRDRIPVTSPGRTLLDLASVLDSHRLEAAINEANGQGLVDPDSLRVELEVKRGAIGAPALRRVLDRHTFALTDSELERRFLRLVRRAKLPKPKTQQHVNCFRVDFLWPELRLVVETDGLRYHRTPAQQSKDRQRDQVLTAAGFTVLRFTHAQVRDNPMHVVATMRSVLARS